jgi:hypothetical protein
MNYVAFDIETTGLTADSEVAVIGVGTGDEVTFYLNGKYGPPDIENGTIEEYSCEANLLAKGLPALCDEHSLLTTKLVGFNAEQRYGSSSFDIPMLRSRCAQLDVDWPLVDAEILEIKDELETFFNLTTPDWGGLNKRPLGEFADYLEVDYPSDAYKSDIAEAIEQRDPQPAELSAFIDQQDRDVPTSSQRSLDGMAKLLTEFEPTSPLGGADIPNALSRHDLSAVVEHNRDDIRATWALLNVLHSYVPKTALQTDTL